MTKWNKSSQLTSETPVTCHCTTLEAQVLLLFFSFWELEKRCYPMSLLPYGGLLSTYGVPWYGKISSPLCLIYNRCVFVSLCVHVCVLCVHVCMYVPILVSPSNKDSSHHKEYLPCSSVISSSIIMSIFLKKNKVTYWILAMTSVWWILVDTHKPISGCINYFTGGRVIYIELQNRSSSVGQNTWKPQDLCNRARHLTKLQFGSYPCKFYFTQAKIAIGIGLFLKKIGYRVLKVLFEGSIYRVEMK